MVQLETLRPDHLDDLYKICRENEPFFDFLSPTIMHFKMAMEMVEGFAAIDSETGTVCGAVTFSEHRPLQDVLLHVTIDRKYWGQWMKTRAIIRKIGEFAYNELNLPRMSGMSIKGVTPPIVDRTLTGIGFRVEGIREKVMLLPDGLHDVVLYGMLRERCKWIV